MLGEWFLVILLKSQFVLLLSSCKCKAKSSQELQHAGPRKHTYPVRAIQDVVSSSTYLY
jgi:hypothetical protein